MSLIALKLVIQFVTLLRFPQHISVAEITLNRYGDETLAVFRTIERTSIKLETCRHHIKFLKLCKNADLIPIFLQFKLSNTRLKKSADIHRTRKRELIKEIHHQEKLCRQHEDKVKTLYAKLKSMVKWVDFVHYRNLINRSVCKVGENLDNKHDRKVTNLRAEQQSTNSRLNPSDVITNLSNYELSTIELDALSKGLKYGIPPSKLKKGLYLSNYEMLYTRLQSHPSNFRGNEDDKALFKSKLREIAYSSLYIFNTKNHKLNLPKEQFDALIKLSKRDDIMILKPDKGTGVVIMNTSDYITKMEAIISDETKFQVNGNQDVYRVCRSIETKVRKLLLNKLKKPGHITTDEYKKLYPNGSHISVLYGLPKVHKQDCPVRPICAAVGSATYELSKYLAKLIKPAASNCYGTDTKDTFDFVEKIKRIDLNGTIMASLDVSSLFTNVPLEKTIQITLDRLYRNELVTCPDIPESDLKDLLYVCLKDNLFIFNGTVYKQVDGVAMGNSLGPVLANIWMSYLEENFLLNQTVAPVKPIFYCRYVDDTFCVFNNVSEANEFLEYANTLDASMTFTMEMECDKKLPFLDTIVHRSSNHALLSTKVKETDKGLFYDFSSYVPEANKFNLVYTKIYRIYKIASNMKIFHSDFSNLRKHLLLNGFPDGMISKCVDKVLSKFHVNNNNGSNPGPDIIDNQDTHTNVNSSVEIRMFLPYMGPASGFLKRKIHSLVKRFYPKIVLKIIFRRGFKLENLFNKKDKFPPSCRSGVVYFVPCTGCGLSGAYMGKTINSLYERFYLSPNGHLVPANTESALVNHVISSKNPQCGYKFDDVKIIENCKTDEQLGYMESILLTHDKPNLNTQERSVILGLFG